MKVTAAIFFGVLLVSVQTPAGEFFKLPLLFSHYMKHQQTNGASIIGFLADHYASGHNDADLPEDAQLPFKDITYSGIGFAVLPEVIKTSPTIAFSEGKKIVKTGTCAPQQHANEIFHPPR